MAESVSLRVELKGYLKREGKQWIAGCPSIQVFSQGSSPEDARSSLREAVGLWFDSCIERGTLDEALREVGFTPSLWGRSIPAGAEKVIVTRHPDDHAILGDPFQFSIEIPAYQAAALMQQGIHA